MVRILQFMHVEPDIPVRRVCTIPVTVALVLSVLLGLAGNVLSAEITITGEKIVIQGGIEENDFKTFVALVDKSRPRAGTVVSLTSPGGLTFEGIQIGQEIRKRGLHTSASGTCTSACGLIWLGGVKRYIYDGGGVGFHQSYDKETKRARGNALVGFYLRDLGLGVEATVFITEASAEEIQWLTPAISRATGIEYEMMEKGSLKDLFAGGVSHGDGPVRKPAPEKKKPGSLSDLFK